jgi:HPt (histidine-containing phosphotransfer) domain-containing protein
METLTAGHDGDRIKAEAHTLKGAAGTLGLRRLSAVAMNLERSALEVTPTDYRIAVAELRTTFNKARIQVETGSP